ncbi:flippase-like domain-containing protein [bacterium]|nr:flippase-like domain-containing protein [candidate division CSSED10-310 bacterium]
MTGSDRRMNNLAGRWPATCLQAGGTITLTAGVFYLLLRHVDVGHAIALIRGMRVEYLLPMIVISLSGNIFMAADKLVRILGAIQHPLSFRESLFIRVGASPIKFVIPAKVGEMVKGFYLQRRHGIPFSEVVSALLFDKISNLIGAMLILVIGTIATGLHRLPALGIIFTVAAGVLLFQKGGGRLVHWADRHEFPWKPTVLRLLRCFSHIDEWTKGWLLIYSMVFTCTEIISSFLATRAMGLQIPFAEILFVIPIIIVIGNLPLTISGLGTREVAFVLLFATYGSNEALFATGVLVSLVEYAMLPVIGLLVMPFFLIRTFGGVRAEVKAS